MRIVTMFPYLSLRQDDIILIENLPGINSLYSPTAWTQTISPTPWHVLRSVHLTDLQPEP